MISLLILAFLSLFVAFFAGQASGIKRERNRARAVASSTVATPVVTRFSVDGRDMVRVAVNGDSFVSKEGITWYREPLMTRCEYSTDRWLERVMSEDGMRLMVAGAEGR